MAILQKYLDLVTAEFDTQPNFMALLAALLQTFVDNQNVSVTIPPAYDLDVAAGEQLDVVGQWIGLKRTLFAPIAGVYFSFDTAGVGFDQGVWWAPFNPTEGLITLDDPTYRRFLRLKIRINHWDGTWQQAQDIYASVFSDSPGTLFFLVDGFDMSQTLAIAGTIPPPFLLGLLDQEYISVRPAAVGQRILIPSVDGGALFGFDQTNDYIKGFDAGVWAIPYKP